jgi:hypothetical protein
MSFDESTIPSLDVVRFRLDRAKEITRQFDQAEADFLATVDFDFDIEHDEASARHSLTHFVTVGPLPPAELALLASETVHHLRSGLDNLAWALARTSGGTPSPETAFPIVLIAAVGSDRRRRRGVLQSLPEPACDIIEDLQPYVSGNGAHPLWVLQALSNTDKHRRLIRFNLLSRQSNGSGAVYDFGPRREVASHSWGAGQPGPALAPMSDDGERHLAFAPSGVDDIAVNGRPSTQTLRDIYGFIVGALPRFELFFAG